MTKPANPRAAAALLATAALAAAALVGTVAADAHLDGWISAALDAGVLITALGIALLMRRRGGETSTLLIGLPQDERQENISQRAGNVTGIVACAASVIGYIISAFTGAHAQAQAFAIMMTICGATLMLSTAVISRRS